MFIDMILFNQMRLMFAHLIVWMDEQNMFAEFEIMVVHIVEAMHLTFLKIYYLEII